jgi:hypothetical protein
LPFASDDCGNLLLIGHSDPYTSLIMFWDHENEPDEPASLFGKIYLLSLSLEGLLNRLGPSEF